MYEPVLVDEKSDLYNVYEVHKNYRILAMAVNVPLQVAEEICHILNEFEIKSLQLAIEAFQFDGDLKGSDGKYYVPEWAVKAFKEGILYFDALTPDTPPIELFIKTLEGTMHAPVGSYVIQGVRGEIYCCKEDIFLETYEPVLERE